MVTKWIEADPDGVIVLAKDKNGGFVQIVVQIPKDLADGQRRVIYGPYLKEFLLVFKKMKGVVYYSRTFGNLMKLLNRKWSVGAVLSSTLFCGKIF